MAINMDEIRRAREEADCLCTPQQVDAAIARLAGEISEQLRDKNPLVYTVMNGGLIFAGKLLPQLDFPLELAYLHASRYGMETVGTRLDWRVRPTQKLEGRQVLVLDDILDEGHTLNAILEYLRDEGAADVVEMMARFILRKIGC